MLNEEKITGFSQLVNIIREKLPLYEFLSKDIDLELKDKYYTGKCPIIVDCLGEFKVNSEKNVYYCFGCHRCGDVVSYTAVKLTKSPLVAALFLAKHALNLDNLDEDAIMANIAGNI